MGTERLSNFPLLQKDDTLAFANLVIRKRFSSITLSVVSLFVLVHKKQVFRCSNFNNRSRSEHPSSSNSSNLVARSWRLNHSSCSRSQFHSSNLLIRVFKLCRSSSNHNWLHQQPAGLLHPSLFSLHSHSAAATWCQVLCPLATYPYSPILHNFNNSLSSNNSRPRSNNLSQLNNRLLKRL